MSSIAPPSHTRRSNTTDDWITPRWLVDRLGGPETFHLDPCASVTQPWPTAKQQYTVNDNGLIKPWRGFVYCNPPYGRRMGEWLKMTADHGNGVALIFARTDTKAFFDGAWSRATSLLFIRGRLTFNRPDGSAPPKGHNSGGPSVLIGYGRLADSLLRDCSDIGQLVVPVR